MLVQLKIYNECLKELVEKQASLPTKYINDIVNVMVEITESLLILNQRSKEKNHKRCCKECSK